MTKTQECDNDKNKVEKLNKNRDRRNKKGRNTSDVKRSKFHHSKGVTIWI